MKHFYIFSFFIVTLGNAKAQQLPLDNQYLINSFALSPAFAGSNGAIESFILYRHNFIGITGAPVTKSFNINGALNEKMGLGGHISSNEIGIFRNLSSSLGYAYRVNLNQEHVLFFGLSAGVLGNSVNLSQSKAELADPVLASNGSISSTLFDASSAIGYRYRKLSAGIVIPTLLEGSLKNGENTVFTNKRHAILHASYLSDINKDWQIASFALLRKTSSADFFPELAAIARYRQQCWLGGTYRMGNTFAMNVGAVFYGKVAFNYSYEFGQGLLANSSGSHEISIGFVLDRKQKSLGTSIFNSEIIPSKKPYFKWLKD